MSQPRTWSLWLPFPPSANNLFAHSIRPGKPGGRKAFAKRYPTAEYRDWQRRAAIAIARSGVPMMREPVVIRFELTPKNGARRDADNFTKAPLDALVRGRVLPDDNSKWVRSITPEWMDPDAARAGIWVRITVAELALFKTAAEPACGTLARPFVPRG